MAAADRDRPRDDGSAVVEFVLVGTFLILLFLGIVQIGLVLYMRNVVVASVAEGARHAANADRTCDDGLARTSELLAETLSARVEVTRAECGPDEAGGAPLVRIDVRVELPLLLVPGLPASVSVDATGRALDEEAQ